MRRISLWIVVALIATLVVSVLPASAQPIYGLSFRPTDIMGDNATRGKVDMVDEGEGFLVSVDLSGAANGLKLANYDGASAFVVWYVDMDGKRHNLGALNDKLVLDDAKAELVAKLFLTPEADAAAAEPTGDRLYEVTLRNVAEVETTAASAKEAPKASASDAATPTTEVKPTEAAKPAATAATTEAKPTVLPTTGSAARDLIVLLIVVVALIAGALRLRAVRV